MKIIVAKDYESMSEIAAEIVADVIKNKPDCVLGLATGSTPIGLYKQLIKKYERGVLSFEKVKSVNLDEYVGLNGEHEQSYRFFMNTNLFDSVNAKKENLHVPCGVGDMEANCLNYREIIKANPIDIQVLGIGGNGHIGFNEPGTAFDSQTHIVDLTEKTISDNARFFEDESMVPRKAITMGIGEIMTAKKIILLASGKNKADAIYQTVCGKVSESCPASVLQRHSDVTLVIDEAAASKLDKKFVE